MNTSGEESRAQLEAQLKKLALQAQEHRPGSRERRLALTSLSRELMQPGRISRPATSFPPLIVEEIYQEALQNLLLYVCQKIDHYDPEKASVLTWVNFLMKKRFFNDAIPDIIGSIQEGKIKNDLKRQLCQEENLEKPLSEQLRNYFEEDPDQIFQNTQIAGRPHITFQMLVLRRLDGKKWREISAEFNTPIGTMNDFYNHKLDKFKDMIQKHLNN